DGSPAPCPARCTASSSVVATSSLTPWSRMAFRMPQSFFGQSPPASIACFSCPLDGHTTRSIRACACEEALRLAGQSLHRARLAGDRRHNLWPDEQETHRRVANHPEQQQRTNHPSGCRHHLYHVGEP